MKETELLKQEILRRAETERRRLQRRRRAMGVLAAVLALAVSLGAWVAAEQHRTPVEPPTETQAPADAPQQMQQTAEACYVSGVMYDGRFYLHYETLSEPDAEAFFDRTAAEAFLGDVPDRRDDILFQERKTRTGGPVGSGCSGKLYTIAPYDPARILALVSDNDVVILRNTDGLTLSGPSDFFEGYLHLSGRVVSAEWQYLAWQNGAPPQWHPLTLTESQMNSFLDALLCGTLVTPQTKKEENRILGDAEMKIVTLHLADGLTCELELYKAGVIGSPGLFDSGAGRQRFVQIDDAAFEAVWQACEE